MTTAEESRISRQRTGVSCGQDEMFRAVDINRFRSGGPSPEQKYAGNVAPSDFLYHVIGKGLPAASLVSHRRAFFDGKEAVEEKDALLRPGTEVAVFDMRFSSEVGADFLEDIDEARRDFHAVGDGKTQPHRLHRLMIGVLSENNHLHVLSVGQSETLENLFFRRIYYSPFVVARTQKVLETAEIFFFRLRPEKNLQPFPGNGKIPPQP